VPKRHEGPNAVAYDLGGGKQRNGEASPRIGGCSTRLGRKASIIGSTIVLVK
jgi:hypothetical protein